MPSGMRTSARVIKLPGTLYPFGSTYSVAAMRGEHPQFHSPTICERGIPPLVFVGEGSSTALPQGGCIIFTPSRLCNPSRVVSPAPDTPRYARERACRPPSRISWSFSIVDSLRESPPRHICQLSLAIRVPYPRVADLCPMPPIRPVQNRPGG